MTSKFVDPTFIPEVEDSPELMRTSLVKRGGRWLLPEFCESVMKKEELDEQFFDCRHSFNHNLQLRVGAARRHGILRTKVEMREGKME